MYGEENIISAVIYSRRRITPHLCDFYCTPLTKQENAYRRKTGDERNKKKMRRTQEKFLLKQCKKELPRAKFTFRPEKENC